MDLRLIIKIALIPLALTAAAVTKIFWKSYPDDNPVEEVVEIIIEKEVGKSIDLTPESPEKK